MQIARLWPRIITSSSLRVKNKFISMGRIDDAVTRILRVKFTMGLFENPLADYSMVNEVGSQVSELLCISVPTSKPCTYISGSLFILNSFALRV
ncbi:putative glucan 1,3-beta-glucosidase [Helianthus annuus]|nr:putative glucan 1,3-beta-glucosidase [Helianthus annuus]KAJ0484399.1 putative glucan 1,3-beta-glucosidase [Helianthus annuus]KAJ0654951.1 putative glucan 1,3-beta-glucosidase [Helianthus annuus]